MAELSFSIRVVRSLAAAMKRKRCQGTALQSPRACCHSFDSCHSWLKFSLSTPEPFHIAHADSESRPTTTRALALFKSVIIRVLRFICVLFLPNSTTTQFARTTAHYSFASWRLCVSQLLSHVFYQPPQLIVIRLIRVIRGLNILSFQLQNHSTSLMPTRRVGLQQRVHWLLFDP